VSQGEGKPDFSDVSRTVRGLLGREFSDPAEPKHAASTTAIGVNHGPVFFLGQIDQSGIAEILATALKSKRT
jgi:hypothetical protein